MFETGQASSGEYNSLRVWRLITSGYMPNGYWLNIGFQMMPDIHAFYQEKGVFGDIGRVIRDSLQVPCDEDQVQRLWDCGRVFLHERNQLIVNRVAQAVDYVIGEQHAAG